MVTLEAALSAHLCQVQAVCPSQSRARPCKSLTAVTRKALHAENSLAETNRHGIPTELTLSEPPQPCLLPPSQDTEDPQPTCLTSRSLSTLPEPEQQTRD